MGKAASRAVFDEKDIGSFAACPVPPAARLLSSNYQAVYDVKVGLERQVVAARRLEFLELASRLKGRSGIDLSLLIFRSRRVPLV